MDKTYVYFHWDFTPDESTYHYNLFFENTSKIQEVVTILSSLNFEYNLDWNDLFTESEVNHIVKSIYWMRIADNTVVENILSSVKKYKDFLVDNTVDILNNENKYAINADLYSIILSLWIEDDHFPHYYHINHYIDTSIVGCSQCGKKFDINSDIFEEERIRRWMVKRAECTCFNCRKEIYAMKIKPDEVDQLILWDYVNASYIVEFSDNQRHKELASKKVKQHVSF